MLLQFLLMEQRTGPNDIGDYAFLTDSQVPDKASTDYTNRAYPLSTRSTPLAAGTLCS
jgi:hypothetical protein